MNYDARKPRKLSLQAVPYPTTYTFAGWILQAFNIVQESMVKSIMNRCECFLDTSEIGYPTILRVNGTPNVNSYLERMAMQSAALVPGGGFGQSVRGFNSESFKYFHNFD
jgi:hypothetical protein